MRPRRRAPIWQDRFRQGIIPSTCAVGHCSSWPERHNPMTGRQSIEQRSINTIRTLAMDAVQAANSGHPGTPMALAPVAYCLWNRVLRFDPADPVWPDRDRFVLSVGHASMLLYAMLHLCQVRAVDEGGQPTNEPAVSLDDIKRFRQLNSTCPGHPEYHWTSGVETTTGPLGQGLGNSVGMAMAQRWKARHFNRPGFDIITYDIVSFCGDGCLMEGVSSEAASLAGHLKLSNLCWVYDHNRITIEGKTSLAFSEDVAERFRAYHWRVVHVNDANDVDALAQAFTSFKQETDRPTLIIVDSHIAFGAPHKQDTHQAHGEPLGEEEIRLTKRRYGWPEDAKFLVPEDVPAHFQSGIGARGCAERDAWTTVFQAYREQYPELADHLCAMERRTLPEGWDRRLPEFSTDPKGMATRESSGKVLNAIAEAVPWVMGGSADLAPSTKTRLTFDGAGDFQSGSEGGRNVHFGVREHAMGAIMSGLALSKVRPYGSGFLIFSDYGRPAIRLAAMMRLPVIYVFTHDSIGVGEDGPTHQPVEQLASLRAIPGLVTIRPGDAHEVAEAWRVIMPLQQAPVALILTRQALPTLDRTRYASAAGLARGAYVFADAEQGRPEALLLTSGSELPLCVQAYERLTEQGRRVRVVSMPSWELFERQSQTYRDTVLPPAVTARVSVEQAAVFGWSRYVGLTGTGLGMTTYGASAPLKELLPHFGFTVDRIVAAVTRQVEAAGESVRSVT